MVQRLLFPNRNEVLGLHRLEDRAHCCSRIFVRQNTRCPSCDPVPLTVDPQKPRRDDSLSRDSSSSSPGDYRRDVRYGRVLEYLNLGWNVLEAGIAIGAGLVAGSTALVGFGIDSVIESLSSLVLIWRLRDGEKGLRRESLATVLVGVSLLILAGYVAVDSIGTLTTQERPEVSYVGIALACFSAVTMPLVAREKRKVAARLASRAMQADSKQTDICAGLSVILLGGLGLNALWGWWWADPIAALAMVGIIAREGLATLRGKPCSGCSCHG